MKKHPERISDPALLKLLFIHYLNRIYQGKRYLNEHLPKIIDAASSNLLKLTIEELLDDVKKQIRRMKEIFTMLNTEPEEEMDSPINSIIREACITHLDEGNKDIVNDIDLMVHMQLVEHVNIISYRMLCIIASKLNYTAVQQQLQECFDESMDDDSLFLEITNEHLDMGQ